MLSNSVVYQSIIQFFCNLFLIVIYKMIAVALRNSECLIYYVNLVVDDSRHRYDY